MASDTNIFQHFSYNAPKPQQGIQTNTQVQKSESDSLFAPNPSTHPITNPTTNHATNPITNPITNRTTNSSNNPSLNTLETENSAEPPETPETINDILINVLENILITQQETLNSVKENNGIIASGWDWVKNKTGLGAGSDKTQIQIDELNKQIQDVKNGKLELSEVYKNITGNELNNDELEKLISGEVDFSKSEIIKDVSKYQQGQKQVVDTISGITSALAIGGLVASGIFTGGLTWLAAGAICVGAGTAAYMVPQALDGITETDGYSGKEIAQDLATGVVSSTINTVGMGAGKAVGNALGAKATSTATQKLSQLAASETTSLILGDGNAISNYLIDTAFDEEKDFSINELGQITASTTAASLMAGASAFGVQSTLGSTVAKATANSSATTQIASKLTTSALTGTIAGGSATFAAGSTNYLLATDSENRTFEDWLNSSTENVFQGAIAGGLSALSFEAIQLAAKTPAPQGTKETNIYKNENGTLTQYLDKQGHVIAQDISAKDLATFLKSNDSLIQYNNGENFSLEQGARTIRITCNGIQQINWWGNPIQNPTTAANTAQPIIANDSNETLIASNNETALITQNPSDSSNIAAITAITPAFSQVSTGVVASNSQINASIVNNTVSSTVQVVTKVEELSGNNIANSIETFQPNPIKVESFVDNSGHTRMTFYDGEDEIGSANIVISSGDEFLSFDLPKDWIAQQKNEDFVISKPYIYVEEIMIDDKLGQEGKYQPRESGKKYGTMCMQRILEWADKQGYESRIMLQPARHGSEIFPGKFYAKIGFDLPESGKLKYYEQKLTGSKFTQKSLESRNVDGRIVARDGDFVFLTEPDILRNYLNPENITSKEPLSFEQSLDYLQSLEQTSEVKDIIKAAQKMGNSPETVKRLNTAIDLLQGGESETQLKATAKALADYLASEDYTKQTMQDISSALGIELGEVKSNKDGILISNNDIGQISARSKTADSIFSKIRSQQIYKLKSDIPTTFEEAHKFIGDAQGVRINLNSIKNPTTDNVVALSNQQTLEIAQNLAEAIRNGDILITEVENYCGPDGIPYFSQEAMDVVSDAYAEFYQKAYQEAQQGSDEWVIKTGEDNVEYLYNKKLDKDFLRAIDCIVSKEKKNGYCATQISIVNQYGQNTELQIRGSEIDRLAQCEHIIYDIKQGKTTVSNSIYDEVREIINEIKKDETAMEKYDKYYADTYRAYREIELGLKPEMPNIEDYEISSTLTTEQLHKVDADGIYELHCRVEATKGN